MRTCQCGGVIREAGKPYWDILPSCTCSNPVATLGNAYTIYATGTAALPPQPRLRKRKRTDANPDTKEKEKQS